ncbi:hypothetical protein [Amycolatopsis speibonae]|uniref:Uncharacterized protein n=1 Tax=Amycolatopsis speibonae TaxID=1450224 RepID=A0ABV7NYI2_9PSEU
MPVRIAWMAWCTALAWVLADSSALNGLELRPEPIRSTARVAYPALFAALRNDRVSGRPDVQILAGRLGGGRPRWGEHRAGAQQSRRRGDEATQEQTHKNLHIPLWDN